MKRSFGGCVLLVLSTILSVHFFSSIVEWKHRVLFEWASNFVGGNFQSTENVDMSCTNNGQPICCGLVKPENPAYNHPKHHGHITFSNQKCVKKRVYHPSSYELLHQKTVEEIQQFPDQATRTAKLLDFFLANVKNDTIWLNRVKERSNNADNALLPETEVDWMYLSRFEITEICIDESTKEQSKQTLNSWVEPLTGHARHPFSYARCCSPSRERYEPYREAIGTHWADDVFRLDYILVKHRADLFHSERQTHVKSYFFDAGTSFFHSSLTWFICAYLQNLVVFDHVYGWEYSLLEPNQFWADVPQKLIPFYSFFNAPVKGDFTESMNIPRLIERLARTDDFVSFKLDIDTPEIEIPLVQQIMAEPALASLIDEFFFELHFQCELMYEYWDDVAHEMNGLILDRHHTFEVFSTLRHMGIRAHFWI